MRSFFLKNIYVEGTAISPCWWGQAGMGFIHQLIAWVCGVTTRRARGCVTRIYHIDLICCASRMAHIFPTSEILASASIDRRANHFSNFPPPSSIYLYRIQICIVLYKVKEDSLYFVNMYMATLLEGGQKYHSYPVPCATTAVAAPSFPCRWHSMLTMLNIYKRGRRRKNILFLFMCRCSPCWQMGDTLLLRSNQGACLYNNIGPNDLTILRQFHLTWYEVFSLSLSL